MKRTIALAMIFVAIMWLPLFGTIINIPDDYPTIQEGIDASNDGDTVLVQPDTYVENINFNGHNIVLGSLFLTTGDTSYISTTIIDGGSLGVVVLFHYSEDSSTVVAGFTIQNGNAYIGGGVFCAQGTSPIIRNNTIKANSASRGGGICCDNSSPTISNNSLYGNSAAYEGGGIFCFNSNPIITNNAIIGNIRGGIRCQISNLTIINNTISANSNDGISCSGSSLMVINNSIIGNTGKGISCSSTDVTITNTICWYNSQSEIFVDHMSPVAITYCDIQGSWEGEGNIDENPLFIDPYNGNYNVCAQSPCIDTGDPDMQDPDSTRIDIGVFYLEHPECDIGNIWYVSTTGNDTTGDGSPVNPFRTIQHAIDVSFHSDTVIVENGTYVENINIHFKNIILASNYILSGDTIDIQNTIIDGDMVSSVIYIDHCDRPAMIKGLTIQNGYDHDGGGIICYSSNAIISNNTIIENIAGSLGGGILCDYSSPIIINNIITRNSTQSYGKGGGISCKCSDPNISNNTISGNSGRGIHCNYSNPIIKNTILWFNTQGEISGYSSSPVITHCDIQGGWEGDGNIDLNPLFIDPFNGNYNVCVQSPCIDAGDPNMQDPDGTRADIGVFYPEHPECDMGNIWYVSTTGNDTTGDGSPENPFRTIHYAIEVSFHNDTIVVENGTYIENINIYTKNVILTSNYIFSGDTLDIQNTIIDGDSVSTVVILEFCDSMTVIMGFTIRNGKGIDNYGGGIHCNYSDSRISNNIICRNSAEQSGGGIHCYRSNPYIVNNKISENSANFGGGIYGKGFITNCIISENSADYEGGGVCDGGPIINCAISRNSATNGGGISCWYSNSSIENNTISENSSIESGGGIFCHSSTINISNNTIRENTTSGFPDSWIGGGGICCLDSKPIITRNIIAENTTNSYGGGIFILGDYPWGGYPTIINNTMCRNSADRGGGVYFWWSNARITNNIFWADTAEMDNEIYLEFGWPIITYCDIQGGWEGEGNIDDDPLFFDAENFDFNLTIGSPCIDAGDPNSPMDPDGTIADIGAFYFDQSVIIKNDYLIPNEFYLGINYPNPFNALTTIKYNLPKETDVTIDIYDILGRKVETLISKKQQAGSHSIIWNAKDLSSGTYFYRITANDFSQSRKMILLK